MKNIVKVGLLTLGIAIIRTGYGTDKMYKLRYSLLVSYSRLLLAINQNILH